MCPLVLSVCACLCVPVRVFVRVCLCVHVCLSARSCVSVVCLRVYVSPRVSASVSLSLCVSELY